MVKFMAIRLSLILFAAVLFSSCQKLYWYRAKVKATPRPLTVHFNLINEAPESVSPFFEEELKKYCLKKLKDRGYVEAQKGRPDYSLEIHLTVDSFPTPRSIWLGPFGAGMPFEDKIRQLSFDSHFMFPDSSSWKNHRNLYYFRIEKRDLKRSKGMANYVINTIGKRKIPRPEPYYDKEEPPKPVPVHDFRHEDE